MARQPRIMRQDARKFAQIGFCIVLLGLFAAGPGVCGEPVLEQTKFTAAGANETLLRITAPGRYSIQAQSPQGTSLDLVDLKSHSTLLPLLILLLLPLPAVDLTSITLVFLMPEHSSFLRPLWTCIVGAKTLSSLLSSSLTAKTASLSVKVLTSLGFNLTSPTPATLMRVLMCTALL
jgi:hypothetical protein